MKWRCTIVRLLICGLGLAAWPGAAAGPFEGPVAPTPHSRIDELVFGRLEALGIEPARLCSDGVFVRRVYLDVLGTLPTADEARAFIASTDPDKRRALIDRVLARDEYADYWAMKWGDLLRIKSEFPINLWPNAVQAYHRWVRTCLRENWPYDRFVRELLTASGSNFRVPPVNFFRALPRREPVSIAQAVALTFMGVRPEGWPPERWSGMAGFFAQVAYKPTSEWKEEIVYFDPGKTNSGAELPVLGTAVFPDGVAVELSPGQDPRAVFADWLVDPRNPWFARNLANRLWAWFLGRGIVHEPDDCRPDNPPSHPELLAYLEQELIAARYDVKRVQRLILNSTTYQLAPIPQDAAPAAEAHFAFYAPRRLEAEVLIDALCQITGTTEKYSSPIPEPFSFIPEQQRSIGLADASITSPFLEMFGRPARDTGLESERSRRPTAAQRLHLLNSSHIQRKLEQGPKFRALLQSRKSPREIVTTLYLTLLSRYPTQDELGIVAEYTKADAQSPRDAVLDVVWALINSDEFVYRH